MSNEPQQPVLEAVGHQQQQQQQQQFLVNFAAADLEPLPLPSDFMTFPTVPPPALSNPRSLSAADDPYAPTPLHEIIELEHAARQRRASATVDVQLQYRQLTWQDDLSHPAPGFSRVAAAFGVQPWQSLPSMGMTESHSSAAPPPTASSQPSTDRARQAFQRKQKDHFLMYMRVLMKYLEQKDPPLHEKAKLIIKDCAERNRRKETGYESVTGSMRERVSKLVGEQNWARAKIYFKKYLRSHQQNTSNDAVGTSSSRTVPSQNQVVVTPTATITSEATGTGKSDSGLSSHDDRCLICFTEARDATIVHGETAHVACCLGCARRLKERGNKCPICRLKIDVVVKHFWA